MRTRIGDHHNNPSLRLIYFLVCLFCFSSYRMAPSQDFWQPANGLSENTPRALLVSGDERIFVGTVRGLFYTNDFGDVWKKIGAELWDSEIRTLEFDLNGDILAATDGQGVFHSTNSGDSWSPLNNGLSSLFVRALLVRPDGTWFAGEVGVSRSTNKGQSWDRVSPELGNSIVYCLAATDQGDIFAGTNSTGIYRSLDNGETWTAVNNGIDGSQQMRTYAIAVGGEGDFFAAMETGVYRSQDRGDTWELTQAGKFTAVSVLHDSSLLCAGDQIYQSTNGGDTWTPTGISGVTNYYSLKQTATGRILAGTAKGVFIREAGADNWRLINNALPSAGIFFVSAHPSGDIYAASKGIAGSSFPGIYVSHNAGGGWQLAFTDSTARLGNSIVYNEQGHIFVGTSGNGTLSGPQVYRSIDQGKTWEAKDKGFEQLSDYSALTLAISRDGTIFAGGGGMFRSTDNGENWNPINNGLPQTRTNSVVIDSLSGVIIATENGLFRSIDHGDHWTPLTDPSPLIPMISLFVSARGYIFAGGFGYGVFRSKDIGQTWEAVNNGLPSGPDLRVDEFAMDQNQNLYIATYVGVYRSKDDGETWESLNNGLSLSLVHSIAINSSGYAFAAQSNGIVRSIYPLIVGVEDNTDNEAPASFLLFQNYPNPFNASTVIEFVLPASGNVSLKIFDVLGVEVETLISEKLPAGKHKIRWEVAAEKPSGIYFYQIRVQYALNRADHSFIETHKMVLLR